MAKMSVARRDPEGGGTRLETYDVPIEAGWTVLVGLLYIYETHDSSLAFQYGCRHEACGLCAVDVDGSPRLACTTSLKADMTIRPMRGLPVARDLVIDRKWIMDFLRRFDLFVPAGDKGVDDWPDPVIAAPQHARLSACTECLICLAACPDYRHGRDDLGGPYHFVKLAQMHWDPRNTIDRQAQAAALGVDRCLSCRKCRCPRGIPIFRDAIAPLASRRG